MTENRHVLVTGGKGFLGRHVVLNLQAAGFAVTTTSQREASEGDATIRVDLTSRSQVEQALGDWRWDAVVNLAGPVSHTASPGWDADRDQMLAHVRIAAELCRIIPREWSGRLVHASSMTVYGPGEALPVAEDSPRRPIHTYGAAKVLAEDVVAAFGPRDTWILRFPGLFAIERRGGALFHFMKSARAGTAIQVNAPSPVSWDLLSVEDAALAVLEALRSPVRGAGPVNVSHGEVVQLEAIARRIAAIPSTPVDVVVRPDVSHPPFQMDIGRARSLLNGWPPASLETRLQELYAAWGSAP